MELRKYQSEAIDRTIEALDRRPILVSPTGSGKTFCAARIVQRLGLRTIWVVHRRELVHQAADTLRGLGQRVGILMANEPRDSGAPIQVASIQTLARRDAPPADMIVVDECHHATAVTFRAAIARYPEARLLGLTATPFRGDQMGLGRQAGGLFDTLVVAAYPDELIADRTLIDPKVFIPETPDLSGIDIVAGEYNLGQLGAAMGKRRIIGNAVDCWREHGYRDGKALRTLIGCVNVEHSMKVVDAFNAARLPGVRAEHLDCDTPDAQRKATLHRLRIGYTTHLSQCNLVSEGWDLPALEILSCLRPTRSVQWHIQFLGRVMRRIPGEKEWAAVLDHAGNHLALQVLASTRLEYSLCGAVRHASGKTDIGKRRCPNCLLLIPRASEKCEGCGADVPLSDAAKAPEHHEGRLVELNAASLAPAEAPKRATALETLRRHRWAPIFDRIEAERLAKGFKPRWTCIQMELRRLGPPQSVWSYVLARQREESLNYIGPLFDAVDGGGA